VRVDLPEPSADERAHSERLRALICREIRANGGAIGFERYMELALYAPGLGYYSAGATKFGRDGDFTTAPELGFVFARCLARAIAPTLRATRGDVLELGPGSGALAADVLLELEHLDALPKRYRLLERSADLRERQRVTLRQRCPHLENLAEWIDVPPSASWRGALIANEVIDALPVRVFVLTNDRIFERCVGIADDDRFEWREVAANASFARAVENTLGRLRAELPQPYRSELCPMLSPWLEEVTRSMTAGAAWFIDYGHERADYYSPPRREGTLRCHYRHRVHGDALILIGLQDITASVDFDTLGEAAQEADFEVDGLSGQTDFLVAHGLGEIFSAAFEAATDESARYGLAQETKHLTLPAEMGQAFKVMVLRRRG
jgi:SAM-dependent MidA family methyltransferase